MRKYSGAAAVDYIAAKSSECGEFLQFPMSFIRSQFHEFFKRRIVSSRDEREECVLPIGEEASTEDDVNRTLLLRFLCLSLPSRIKTVGFSLYDKTTDNSPCYIYTCNNNSSPFFVSSNSQKRQQTGIYSGDARGNRVMQPQHLLSDPASVAVPAVVANATSSVAFARFCCWHRRKPDVADAYTVARR